MGFGSFLKKTIGKVAAPIAGALGTVLGGPAGGVAGYGMADAIWDSSGSQASADAQTQAYNDQLNLARAQFEYQKELHKNQVQWRVEDAKKAGLHPLAALGVSSASYSPVSFSGQPGVDTDFASELGQNLNRAIMQGKTQKERAQALARQDQYDDIMMRKANAEADLAETTAASERLRLHRELFPPSPVANASQDSQLPSDSSFRDGVTPLLELSRVGNTFISSINRDISDAITEDMVRNLIANANAEFQSGRITPEVYKKLTPLERDMIKKGEMVLEYEPPSSWRLRYTPKMMPRYQGNRQTVGGKLNRHTMKY